MKKQLFLLILCFSTLIYAQWNNDPAINNAICDLSGEQAIPKIVTSSIGDTYIGYFSNDSGNYDVRLQRLDSQGNELWEHNGILISDHAAMSWLTDWDMTVDNSNYAILTFQDIRNGGNNNIYVYKISPDGSFYWGEDGIELSNSAAFDVAPKVCVTSEGGTVITWQSDDAIIMQRIAGNGTLVWGPNGITLSCADTYSWPQPFAVEDDHILLKFFHDTGPAYSPTRHCLMQKFDNDGNAAWASDTVVSDAGGISAWTQIFPIESDGANGCFIAWHDDRDNNMDASSFIQHVNSDGTVGFTANGIELSTQAARENYYPTIAFNSTNWELYTYWMETNSDQNQRGLYGQKLDAEGNRLWTDSGKAIIEISATGIIPIAARQANDDVIVCFEEASGAVNSFIKATRLDADGEFVWDNDFVTMCSVASSKVHSEASNFAYSQIICAWEDDRNGGTDIFAQNITIDGEIGMIEEFVWITNFTATYINENVSLFWTTEWELDNYYWNIYRSDTENFGEAIQINPGTILGQGTINEPTDYEYIDEDNFLAGNTYWYWLETINAIGECAILEPISITIQGVGINENEIVTDNYCLSNYPNPFNPITNISYSINETENVMIEVYNLRGQLVKTLVNEIQETGEYNVVWNGTDNSNKPVSSGVYLYKMKSGNYISTKKMILMK